MSLVSNLFQRTVRFFQAYHSLLYSFCRREKSFHLLRLPYVPFRKIIHQMKIFEVAKLSQTSEKTRLEIKKIKRKVYKIMVENFIHDYPVGKKYEFQKFLIFESLNDVIFSYNGLKTRPIKSSMQTSINDVHQFINLFHIFGSQKAISLEILSPYNLASLLYLFLNLFEVDHIDLQFDIDQLFGDYQFLLNKPWLTKCKYELVGREIFLTSEQLSKVLNSISVEHGLTLKCQFAMDLDKTILLNIRRLDSYFNPGFTLDDLKSMNCEELIIWKHSFTPEDINNFIRNWLNGSMQTLKRFHLSNALETRDFVIVLNEIAVNRWDGVRRAEYYRIGIQEFDCSDGWDIERNDGVIATALFGESSFDFLVWR
ncbi:F-box domain-containing protein [Caenorhabditis elegans]|uniref:F-box domain-containing protein n=1 Tax=Caenorhabditis elegans TaxID=6239 RepID=Q95YC2_CAEEL|nr:F-box domain-containing protein [Caenorhabditis elegans]CCD61499.1 F-box domain-containing protein [Caenorhabditis elegans]|eukprot:NP_504399.1 Uncharacterized protein CELE_C52A10.3 [Caenorhabditis elegans]